MSESEGRAQFDRPPASIVLNDPGLWHSSCYVDGEWLTLAAQRSRSVENPAIAIKFAVSGQNCIAANRIFVERPVYERHRLAFGMVAVNTATFTGAPMPFGGGGKASGLGREGGIEGFDPFVETKFVCLGHLGLPQPQDACVSNASSD